MPDEILKLPEVAQLLKVADKTVYTMAQRSERPAFKVRGQWRFKRIDIDRWIEWQKAVSHSEKGSKRGQRQMSTLKFMRCELPAAFYTAVPTAHVIQALFGQADDEAHP